MDKASATETEDAASIPARVKPKTTKIDRHGFSARRSVIEKMCEAPPCVVDRWTGGSLTRKPKGSFTVSWPWQLGE